MKFIFQLFPTRSIIEKKLQPFPLRGVLRNWLHFHKKIFLRFLTRFNKIWNRLSFSFPKMYSYMC